MKIKTLTTLFLYRFITVVSFILFIFVHCFHIFGMNKVKISEIGSCAIRTKSIPNDKNGRLLLVIVLFLLSIFVNPLENLEK